MDSIDKTDFSLCTDVSFGLQKCIFLLFRPIPKSLSEPIPANVIQFDMKRNSIRLNPTQCEVRV